MGSAARRGGFPPEVPGLRSSDYDCPENGGEEHKGNPQKGGSVNCPQWKFSPNAFLMVKCYYYIRNIYNVYGMMKMGGRKRNGRRIAAVCISTAGVLFALYVVFVNFLVSAALVPSFMERLEAFERITDESYAAMVQTSDIQRNRQTALQKTQEWLETAERQKISVVSEDGYILIAETFSAQTDDVDAGKNIAGEEARADSQNHKWVILLHGYTGWKEEMYPFAYWYHGEGYHVLAPDLRCQGESEGDFIGMGWTDRLDGMLWIQYILSQDADAEIVLHGQSMGAAAALMMAGEETLPHNVKAVVSDCAYTDAYAMFDEKIGEWFHLPSFPLVDSACLVLRIRGGYNLKDASALNAVRKSRIPMLFIHGEEDEMISVEMTKELYEAAAGEKELLIVANAGHAQAPDKDPDTYFGTIRKFIAMEK